MTKPTASRTSTLLSLTLFITGLMSSTAHAAQWVNLHSHAALTSIAPLQVKAAESKTSRQASLSVHGLRPSHKPFYDPLTNTTVRKYQQYYRGYPIVGGEIVQHEDGNTLSHRRAANSTPYLNGQYLQDFAIATQTLTALDNDDNAEFARESAIARFEATYPAATWHIKPKQTRLVIGYIDDEATPLFEVTFRARANSRIPVSMVSYVDANDPTRVVKQWSETKYFNDSGIGGNKKTGSYVYGTLRIPYLPDEEQDNELCTMHNKDITVVDMRDVYNDLPPDDFEHRKEIDERLDRIDNYRKPYQYTCGSTTRDAVPFYGAYSPADDAFEFAHIVWDFYHDWYRDVVLPLKMTLRVHVREPYDPYSPLYANAFWDPETKTMNFGDGDNSQFYPLVTLDITGHEISHGYTERHAKMAYHDQSGALNESFSDMAGKAVEYYVMQKYPFMYHAIHHHHEMDWKFGTIAMRNKQAMRFLDQPSKDGDSADCFSQVEGCKITYRDVEMVARRDHFDGQSYLVHTASGIFNKAFYHLSATPGWDPRKAFRVMLVSNKDGYWNQGSIKQKDYFNHAACGSIQAAKKLFYNAEDVRRAFQKVGLLKNDPC